MLRSLKKSSELAAAMVEYALAAGILVGAFVLSAQWLGDATNYRMEANKAAVDKFTPCVDSAKFKDGLLRPEECK